MSGSPTWLVTGANGFLGANIGAYLAGRAHRVGAVRSARDDDELFDAYVPADLTEPSTLAAVIEYTRPDVVIHSAAMASHEACESDPDSARLVNTTASEALARAAARAGSRFVLISTDAVFDGTQGHYSEDDAPAPTSVYGRTKVEAELAVLDATDALVVRTNFFGWSPTGRRSILEFFVNALSAGQQVRGFTDFTTSSAYAQVLAQALWDLVAIDASSIVHVTSPDALTKYAFGVAVAEEFGLDPRLITPTRSDIQPPREGDISLDVSRAQALLGRPLPTMEEGIRLAHADAATLRRTVAGTPEP
jgi:dTDP-4-dehydrorhamnose reductase